MQNYYSKRTVEKLRTQLNGANATVAAQIDKIQELSNELAECNEDKGRYYNQLREAQSKITDLETQLGLRKSYRDGHAMKAVEVKRTAARRAHEELRKVKPQESNTALLHRAIGNAQGILAAAIDASREEGESYAEPISLYPDDERREEEERRHPRHMYRGGGF